MAAHDNVSREIPQKLAPEPRWPATISLLAIGMLQFALPRSMTAGPPWLLLVIVCVLLVPIMYSRRRGMHQLNHSMGVVLAVDLYHGKTAQTPEDARNLVIDVVHKKVVRTYAVGERPYAPLLIPAGHPTAPPP